MESLVGQQTVDLVKQRTDICVRRVFHDQSAVDNIALVTPFVRVVDRLSVTGDGRVPN